MSERINENNPEKNHPPLRDNCDRCKEDYDLTPDNTELYHYSSQDELDNIVCACPNCSYRTVIFIGKQTFEIAVARGITPNCDDKNAPEEVYEMWRELKGFELPKTYELTNRHEALVHKFGEALMAMPDEIFWDNIEAETDRPYNEKWID